VKNVIENIEIFKHDIKILATDSTFLGILNISIKFGYNMRSRVILFMIALIAASAFAPKNFKFQAKIQMQQSMGYDEYISKVEYIVGNGGAGISIDVKNRLAFALMQIEMEKEKEMDVAMAVKQKESETKVNSLRNYFLKKLSFISQRF
jgi:hypothetical protein